TAASIGDALQKARDKRVLVVGETIIDEYYRCSTLGKSSKAPVISTRYESHERYAGGALAIANHLVDFCGEVALCTMLGEINSEEEWLRSQLAPGIALSTFRKADAPTIVKRRYLESYFGTALFSVNFLNDRPLTGKQSAE